MYDINEETERIEPPAITGDIAADRKNYIETCFVMELETMMTQRKSVLVNSNCILSGNDPACDIGGFAPGENMKLDKAEPITRSRLYAWDKCGDLETFDETSDPRYMVSYVDKQIESLKPIQSVDALSPRRGRRFGR